MRTMSRIAGVVLLVAALSACSSSDSDGAPGGQGAGEGAGGNDAGDTGGASGAGQGGDSGASNTGGSGGMTSGSGGASGTGGAQAGSGGTMVSGSGGSDGGEPDDASVGDSDCVVAQRIDECCPHYIAVESAEAKAEPCIVALGEPRPVGSELDECMPEQNCALVDCAPPDEPTSLSVFRGDGACMFTDECMTAADCVLATERTHCCSCPVSMPKSLVDQELCITAEGESPDFATCGGNNCFAVLCAPCQQPLEPTCAMVDGYKRCR
jgi:hypothetical protein